MVSGVVGRAVGAGTVLTGSGLITSGLDMTCGTIGSVARQNS